MKKALLAALLLTSSFCLKAQDGKTVFAQCAACHTLDGDSAVAPTLKGVFGRKAGSVAGFRYSRAMKNAQIVWDEKTIDAYITDPQKVVPGNLMPFSGLPKAEDRAAVIAYLKSAQ